MTLSAKFYDAIQEHRVPVNVHHLAKLGRSPRRMDLYTWLAYRTPRIASGQRIPISLHALHSLFGADITRVRDFRTRLRTDLVAIHATYPDFNLKLSGDILWLSRSPPPVPYGKIIHRLPE